MKAYIDVNFTIEDDLSNWDDEDKGEMIKNKDKLVDLFKKEFFSRYHDYKDDIKDLDITITFEDRS